MPSLPSAAQSLPATNYGFPSPHDAEMNGPRARSAPAEESLLSRVDRAQTEVLKDLERLNERIESVLQEQTHNRKLT